MFFIAYTFKGHVHCIQDVLQDKYNITIFLTFLSPVIVLGKTKKNFQLSFYAKFSFPDLSTLFLNKLSMSNNLGYKIWGLNNLILIKIYSN